MEGNLRLSAILFFLALTSSLGFANTAVIPSTTLAIETGNNTSAAVAFTAQSNGNAGAGNVSKMPMRSLLYSGATTKMYAGIQPWYGGTDHMNVGYDSADPVQIQKQVA